MCRPYAACWCAAMPCSRSVGLEAQFRGLYEDQVLYVKAGLQLTAVIDPRPLALYRQHPGSACEVSIAEGAWSRRRPERRPRRASSRGCRATSAARRGRDPRSRRSWNATSSTTAPIRGRLDRDLRQLLRGATPESLRAVVRALRRRWSSTHPAQSPVSVVGEWSAQHLRAITASLTGSVLVIVPAGASGEPWASAIPLDAFGAAAHVTALPARGGRSHGAFRSHRGAVRCDPSPRRSTSCCCTLQPLLREAGSLVALMPGPAWPARAAR